MKRRRLKKSDLLEYPWALFRSDQRLFREINRYFLSHGLEPPEIAVRADSFITVLELVKTGELLTCMADPLLPIAHRYDIGWLPFNDVVWSFHSGVIYRESLQGFQLLQRMIELLVEECASRKL